MFCQYDCLFPSVGVFWEKVGKSGSKSYGSFFSLTEVCLNGLGDEKGKPKARLWEKLGFRSDSEILTAQRHDTTPQIASRSRGFRPDSEVLAGSAGF